MIEESAVRLIGHIETEERARMFSDFLLSEGISNQIDPAADGLWEVWILPEKRLEEAGKKLEAFLGDPDNPAFAGASQKASEVRAQEQADQRNFERRVKDAASLFGLRVGPLTAALMAFSIALSVVSKLGANDTILSPFFITPYYVQGESISWANNLPEVFDGQVWRLITPVFVHFGILHIIFNMMWLFELGTFIERRMNTLYLAVLVVGIGILSNLGQFYLSGPRFGGMSGVLYGLLGYLWIRGKFDPWSGILISRNTVLSMLFWLFLCLGGMMGPVANAAHFAGLAVGMIWGYLSARRSTWKRGHA